MHSAPRGSRRDSHQIRVGFILIETAATHVNQALGLGYPRNPCPGLASEFDACVCGQENKVIVHISTPRNAHPKSCSGYVIVRDGLVGMEGHVPKSLVARPPGPLESGQGSMESPGTSVLPNVLRLLHRLGDPGLPMLLRIARKVGARCQ